MSIQYYHDLEQGSEEWKAARCGLLTASEMSLILTPKQLKSAYNDKSRSHLYELLAQRITRYVEPHYISDDMLRGHEDELDAKILYNEKISPLQNCGFITNDKWGFKIGFSPDALVGDDGIIECKSRRQKFQIQTIIENAMPEDFLLQVQTGLLVSELKWCDFISYSGGLPMVTIRVFPDEKIHNAIVDAATEFEGQLVEKTQKYKEQTAGNIRLLPTVRRVEQQMI